MKMEMDWDRNFATSRWIEFNIPNITILVYGANTNQDSEEMTGKNWNAEIQVLFSNHNTLGEPISNITSI